MKKILFALMLCLPMTFIGQISSKANPNTRIETKVLPATFAEILMTVYSPEKQKITINFGAKDEYSAKKSKAAQTDFFSLIDALNAMSMEGYELVDSYQVSGKESTQHHFIMAKRATSQDRQQRGPVKKK